MKTGLSQVQTLWSGHKDARYKLEVKVSSIALPWEGVSPPMLSGVLLLELSS